MRHKKYKYDFLMFATILLSIVYQLNSYHAIPLDNQIDAYAEMKANRESLKVFEFPTHFSFDSYHWFWGGPSESFNCCFESIGGHYCDTRDREINMAKCREASESGDLAPRTVILEH